MSLNLQQTALGQVDPQNDPTLVQAVLEDTQNNILKSNGRDHQVHLFIRFANPPDGALAWLRTMGAQYVTSAWAQKQGTEGRRASGANGGLCVNVCLSAAGYQALGLAQHMPDDAAFAGGAKGAVARLNDPPVAQWEPVFQQEIHALVIVADDDAAQAAATADAISAALAATAGQVIGRETGGALRVDTSGHVTTDGISPVHEHFGFADGISQPLFFQDDLDAARLSSGGFDRYDPSAPLGTVLLKDPGGGQDGYGSYFVYRKLRQDVLSFHRDEANLATALAAAARGDGATPTDAERDLACAYIVGRFRDGTPVVEQAVDGWRSEPNNFSYDADVDGMRCPFYAHARKMNPRGDKARQFGLPAGEDRARRIARRAISYGPLTLDPAPADEVGLLFICAQSSIADQFEFLQITWANFTDFLRPATGLDPIIGEPAPNAAAVPQQWPRDYGYFNELSFPDSGPPVAQSAYIPYLFGQWVTMRGGEYFFAPSLSFLTSAGTAT